MKIVKNKKTLELSKVDNQTAFDLVNYDWNVDGNGNPVTPNFTYSTKGAWKSRQNTLKKQAKIERRIYFRKRRLAKTAQPNDLPRTKNQD